MSMRLGVALFALLLAGCESKDPVWEMPCEQRPAREVLPGTGEDDFEPIAQDPIEIQYGDQGGSHLWFAVRLRGFGPEVLVQFGVTDPDDPTLVYSGPLQEGAELKYNSGEVASEASGLYAYLGEYDPDTMVEAPNPQGKSVLFWAEVADQCTPVPVRGQAIGQVR